MSKIIVLMTVATLICAMLISPTLGFPKENKNSAGVFDEESKKGGNPDEALTTTLQPPKSGDELKTPAPALNTPIETGKPPREDPIEPSVTTETIPGEDGNGSASRKC